MSRTARHLTATRGLHLVDLDNLISGPWNADRVPDALERYCRASSLRPGDHLIIAADATLAAKACFLLPTGARLLSARGANGADRRLLEAATPEHIARRYSSLVIGSGDHCFTGLARRVRALGTPVSVVARDRSLSHRLRDAADRVLRLDALPPAA